MKKIRGEKTIGVTIHLYMETSQGNSLCSYFYLKIAKMPCFSSTKLEHMRAEKVLWWGVH
jgi:hypothetical protein